MDDDARAFAQQGALLVRGALAPERVAAFRSAAEHAIAERARLAEAGALEDGVRERFARGFLNLRDVTLPYPQESLVPPIAASLARTYLDAEPRIAASRGFRFADPAGDATHLAFHRDEDILRRPAVNVWIALTACGVDAPGLEIVLGGARPAVAAAGDPHAQRGIDRVRLDAEAVVASAGADALFAPAFEAGDVLIFSGATMHRTFVRPGMTRRRISLEFRLVAAEQ